MRALCGRSKLGRRAPDGFSVSTSKVTSVIPCSLRILRLHVMSAFAMPLFRQGLRTNICSVWPHFRLNAWFSSLSIWLCTPPTTSSPSHAIRHNSGVKVDASFLRMNSCSDHFSSVYSRPSLKASLAESQILLKSCCLTGRTSIPSGSGKSRISRRLGLSIPNRNHVAL